jgi:shikimate dehydrogenase
MINGKTKLLGVIGNPIEHTASPSMHNAVLKELNLNYVYVPILVNLNKIETAMSAIKALNISGINVTIPFKELVMPFLDEIDPYALKVGAVNTIVNNDGYLKGYNTDGEGFIYSLLIDGQYETNNKKVVLIGAGGAAKGISYALLAQDIKQLTIVNRTIDRALLLGDTLKNETNIPIHIAGLNDPELNNIFQNADLIINTTSIGMEPNNNEQPISDYSWATPNHFCCDIIYKPLKTKFLINCEQKGANILNGVGMLAGQGALAFKLFTGFDASYEIMKMEVLKNVNKV